MTRPHLAALAAAFYVGLLAGTWAERQPRRSPTAARRVLANDPLVAAHAAELGDLEDRVLATWHGDPARLAPTEASLARRRATGAAYLQAHPELRRRP